MNEKKLKQWLDAYRQAWECRDPAAAAALFSDDAAYQETAFANPLRGRAAILEYWSQVARSQEQVQFDSEVLAVTRDAGIVHWRAEFVRVPSGVRVRLDGIFVLTFDAEGRCQSLREWWQRQGSNPASRRNP